MAEIYGVEVPDELINMSIEDFCRAVTPIIGYSRGPAFMLDMLAADAPSLSAMRDFARQWTNRPDLFRGVRLHTPDTIDANPPITPLVLGRMQSDYRLRLGEMYSNDLAALNPLPHVTIWKHQDMLNLLHESVPKLSVEPRRNGQEVSVNMFSSYGKGILCHINQYGELWLHEPFHVEKKLRGLFRLCDVYQTLKEAFTIDLYLKKSEPYLIDLLDIGMINGFKAKVVQGENYYMSGVPGEGYTDNRAIQIGMTIAAGDVIATGMEDLYSIISKKITVAQPERKADFGVVQGRLGR